LTYKSINAILGALECSGELVRFVPVYDPGETELREILMTPGLHAWLYESDSRKSLDYKANIQAFLGRFVKEEMVDNKDYMKSWAEDVFELRVQNQRKNERLRIFGGFARPNTFVCLHRKMRHEFKKRKDWEPAIERVVTRWEEMFPGHLRVPAKPFSGCVSQNYYDVFE